MRRVVGSMHIDSPTTDLQSRLNRIHHPRALDIARAKAVLYDFKIVFALTEKACVALCFQQLLHLSGGKVFRHSHRKRHG